MDEINALIDKYDRELLRISSCSSTAVHGGVFGVDDPRYLNSQVKEVKKKTPLFDEMQKRLKKREEELEEKIK